MENPLKPKGLTLWNCLQLSKRNGPKAGAITVREVPDMLAHVC